MADTFIAEPDVVLIGAGIMSATLGVFLKELEPSEGPFIADGWTACLCVV